MSRYGNWGRPTPISELKYWVQHWARRDDETSQSLARKYYTYYKTAGGKSSFNDIKNGKDVAVPKHLR